MAMQMQNQEQAAVGMKNPSAGSRLLGAVRKTGLALACACMLCAAGTPAQEAQAYSFSLGSFVNNVAQNYKMHRNQRDPAKTARAQADRVCADGLGSVIFGYGGAGSWLGQCARAKSRAAQAEEQERSRHRRQGSAFR